MIDRFERVVVLASAVTLLAMSGCSDAGEDEAVETAQGFLAAPQAVSDDSGSGISVVADRRQTVPADRAVIVVAAPYDDLTGTSGEFSEPDRSALIDAITELGFDESAISVTSSTSSDFYFGGGDELQVEVLVQDVAEAADDVFDAAEEAVDDVGEGGVRFLPSDCTAALGELQEAAVAEVIADAEALAASTGIELGELRSVSEVGSGYLGFGFPLTTPCPDGTSGPLVSPDSPAEVDLSYSVRVTFDVADARDASSTAEALGSGSVTAAADEASIVVLVAPENYDSVTPVSIDASERSAVLDAVSELGVDPSTVRFQAGDDFNGIPTLVVIPAPIDRVGDGDDFVDAVGDAVDEDVDGGVVFRSSECSSLLDQARTLALADADADLVGLAQGELGEVIRLSEEPPSEFAVSFDPCDTDSVPMDEYGYPDIAAFDARAEVTVSAGLLVTRAVI